jgi:hypothetical protein
MAKSKITAKERAELASRLFAIYDEIPSDYKDTIKTKRPHLTINQIENCRFAKSLDREIIEDLEEIVAQKRKKKSQFTNQ